MDSTIENSMSSATAITTAKVAECYYLHITTVPTAITAFATTMRVVAMILVVVSLIAC